MSSDSSQVPGLAWFLEIAARAGAPARREAVRAGFVERRLDLRVPFGTDREAAVEHRARAGVACDLDGAGVRVTLDADDAGSGIPEPRVDAARALRVAGDLVRTAANAGLRLRGAWIASDQRAAGRTPSGRTWSDRRQGIRIRLEAVPSNGTGELAATVDHVLRDGRDFDPGAAVRALAARAAVLADARSCAPGETRVVLGPGIGGLVVHELIGHAAEGDAAIAGGWPTTGSDLRFRHAELRVLDDPRRARVAWGVDDEGEPARLIALVDRGRVVGRLLDRRHAAVTGAESTGHGRRSSYLDDVRPRMGCTFVAAGSCDPAEVVRDTPRGVLVHRMAAASTDTVDGVAWFRVVDADRIEGGRVLHPLRPFLLEIRAAELIESLDRIASDLEFDRCVAACVKGGQPLAVSVGSPTIRTGVARVLT